MKLCLLLLVALAAVATARRDLLQVQPCSVRVSSTATTEAQDAISVAITDATAKCKAAGTQAACGAGCKSYADAAAQAISDAYAKLALSVFGAVSGGPNCYASGQGRANAQSQASATAVSLATAITELCNGLSATVWRSQVEQALAKVYGDAAIEVACRGGGNAQAGADVAAKNTLTAVACSISNAFSICICKTPPSGGAYADTCWTGILNRQEVTADAWTQANGRQCAASATGGATATTTPTRSQSGGGVTIGR